MHMAVNVGSTVLWDMMPCSKAGKNEHFRRRYACLPELKSHYAHHISLPSHSIVHANDVTTISSDITNFTTTLTILLLLL